MGCLVFCKNVYKKQESRFLRQMGIPIFLKKRESPFLNKREFPFFLKPGIPVFLKKTGIPVFKNGNSHFLEKMGIPVFVKHVHKKTGIPIFMADIEIVTPLMAPFFICRSPYRSNTHPRIATR